jgi:hypothetical protein
MAMREDASGGRAEREALIQAATTAWRPADVSGAPRAHPAWADLDPEARVEAFARTQELRVLEAALDADGLSTTARAVLARIAGA